MPNFNASCSAGFYDAETLAEMRFSVLCDLGYAARANNPPPGMATFIDNRLRRDQAFLYRKYPALHTKRFFSWAMTVGERFYGFRDNGDACAKKLDPLKIVGAYVEDLNGTWLRLARGIPPTFYTSASHNGLPARYTIRQEIEVFPAPDQAYTLWVEGHFGLMRLTEDTDISTIDSELLTLWTTARLKSHYGQPDARDVLDQAQSYLRTIIGDSHGDKRYVPGAESVPAATRPLFLDLEE